MAFGVSSYATACNANKPVIGCIAANKSVKLLRNEVLTQLNLLRCVCEIRAQFVLALLILATEASNEI